MKLNVNGSPEVVDIDESSETKRDIVGGWLECVGLESGLDVWINEEGAINGMELNFSICRFGNDGNIAVISHIYGNLLCSP